MARTLVPRPKRTRPAAFTFVSSPSSGAFKRDGSSEHVTRLTLTVPALDRGGCLYPDSVLAVRPHEAGHHGVLAELRMREDADGTVRTTAWVQGGDCGGRRYMCRDARGWEAWDDAARRIFAWAERRFRVADEG